MGTKWKLLVLNCKWHDKKKKKKKKKRKGVSQQQDEQKPNDWIKCKPEEIEFWSKRKQLWQMLNLGQMRGFKERKHQPFKRSKTNWEQEKPWNYMPRVWQRMEKTQSLLKSNTLNMWQNPTKEKGEIFFWEDENRVYSGIWICGTFEWDLLRFGNWRKPTILHFLKKSMKVGKDLWELPPKLLRNYEHVPTLAKIPSNIWVTSLRQFPVLDWHGVIMCNIPLAGHVSMARNPGHWFQWI